MAFEIPKEDVKSIATIKAIPSASIGAFVSALEKAPPIPSPKRMAEHLAKSGLLSIHPKKVTGILEMLYTLYHMRELAGVPTTIFLEDLMGSIRNAKTLKIEADEEARLRSVFQRLLDIDTLKIISKAARLQRDGERLYCTAKVLSDIRPVFGKDPTKPPKGMVLTHTLKVGYHEGREHSEFHVVLDSSDLDSLGEVVQRAKEKDRSLRELMKSANFTSLDE